MFRGNAGGLIKVNSLIFMRQTETWGFRVLPALIKFIGSIRVREIRVNVIRVLGLRQARARARNIIYHKS